MADLLTAPVNGATTVDELLRRHAETAPVLSRLGIDACCGGEQSLEEAARRAGLSLAELLAELRPLLEAA